MSCLGRILLYLKLTQELKYIALILPCDKIKQRNQFRNALNCMCHQRQENGRCKKKMNDEIIMPLHVLRQTRLC